MIPTIDNPGPFDAMTKARHGEPIFQLLGRDIAAPGAITEWCRLRRNDAIKRLSGDELAEELRQCADAEAIALAMDAYRNGYDNQKAPVAERVAHSGVQGESQEQRDRSRKISEAVEHLRNAAYHMAEVETVLDMMKNDFRPALMLDIVFVCDIIAQLDEAIAPKRTGTQQPLDLPEPVQPSFEGEEA